MNSKGYLGDQDFAHIVRNAPLVSIDIVLRDPDGFAFLGLRNNEPAKDIYFVPGGVIRKNETIAAAYARILETETSLKVPFSQARLLGAYEHFYATNRFHDPGYGTHYVVLGYETQLPHRPSLELDAQHRDHRWMMPQDILVSDVVHDNTKAYFKKA